MGYDWFKVHSKGWLDGSVRVQYDSAERGVWMDLLAFGNECRERGVLARAPGIPYTKEELAVRFGVPLELLNRVIDKALQDKNKEDSHHRMEQLPDGTLIITNWQKYNPNKGK